MREPLRPLNHYYWPLHYSWPLGSVNIVEDCRGPLIFSCALLPVEPPLDYGRPPLLINMIGRCYETLLWAATVDHCV